MSQTTITLLFLVFAIVSFILEKIPLGLTASICALGLTLTGILDVSTTFSQYVNSNVILCIGMFVVGQALFETGMANKIGGLVTRFAKTEKTLIIAIMDPYEMPEHNSSEVFPPFRTGSQLSMLHCTIQRLSVRLLSNHSRSEMPYLSPTDTPPAAEC